MSELFAWSAALVALVGLANAATSARRHPEGTAVKRPNSWFQQLPEATYLILAVSGAAALLLDAGTFPSGWIATAFQAIGLLLALAGLVICLRAGVELGGSYSADTRVWTEQQLVTRGLYKLARHPIYLGSIALWLGVGLGTRSWLTLVVCLLMLVPAYYGRARLEDRLLLERFGSSYRAYRARVPMLTPWPRPDGTVEEEAPAQQEVEMEVPEQPPVPEQE